MIVRKVAFEKTIGMPNYSNDRPIVVEADLEPGETKEQAWTRINQDMIEWHKKEYPHLYQEEKYPQPFPDPDRHQRMTDSKTPMEVTYQNGTIPIISKDHERMEIEIDNCSTKEELTAWNKRHDILPGKILTYYTERLKQLTHGC